MLSLTQDFVVWQISWGFMNRACLGTKFTKRRDLSGLKDLYPNCDLLIAAMKESKHTSIMKNTLTTKYKAVQRTRIVGGVLAMNNYAEYIYW